VINNSDKPRVVLDLSDQLNDDGDDSFENFNRRPSIDKDLGKIQIELADLKKADEENLTSGEANAESDAAKNEIASSRSAEANDGKSRTNFAFVSSSQTLSQAVREQPESTENADNYVNLAVSKI
jgi:hypothetical protein